VLHGFRFALDMHAHIRNMKPAHRYKHIIVHGSAADIINDRCACSNGLFRNSCIVSVNRNKSFRKVFMNGFNDWQYSCEVLLPPIILYFPVLCFVRRYL
jgi:hypothetical protein